MLAIVTAGVLPAETDAADWTIKPRLDVRETYTDNLRLAPRGQEESDWVTEIEPGVSVQARGARLQLQADYTFQYRLYNANSDDNGHNHRLSSNGLLDVWNRNLFVQASANIYQQNVSPLGAQPISNVNLSGNRTEVRQANISPYWVSRLGTWANLQARYSWDQAESTGTTSALDSESKSIHLGLTSGPEFNDLGWSTTYSLQQIESSSGQFERRDIESITVSGRYRLHPTLFGLASIGRDDNTYGSTLGSTGGNFYDIGLEWAPSNRTRIRGTVGNHYYGNTYSFDAEHRTRLTTWTLGYQEQIIGTPGVFSAPGSASTAATLDRLFISEIPDPIARKQFVEAVILQNGLPATTPTSVDFLTNQVSLSKRLHGAFALRGVRATMLVTIFRDNRSNESTGATTLGTDPFSLSSRVVQTGYAAFVGWRFTERTSGSVSGTQSRTKLTDTGQEDTYSTVRVGVSHQLQPKVRGAVNYRLSDRDSNTPGVNSRENAIIGTLSLTF